jgi:hypothetical protein
VSSSKLEIPVSEPDARPGAEGVPVLITMRYRAVMTSFLIWVARILWGNPRLWRKRVLPREPQALAFGSF